MAYTPIANITFQYDEQDNWYLKFYKPATTTPIAMATDGTGATTLDKCQLDVDGFPTTDGTAIFIPHLDQNYDAFIFPTAAEADANDTINAKRVAQDINPFNDDFSVSRRNVTVVTGQTVYPLTFNVSGEAVVIANGEVLCEGASPAGDYTLTPNGTFYDLNLTNPLFAGDKLQVWSRIMSPAKQPVNSSNLALKFITDIRVTDLTDVDNFVTQNYDTVGDNGGAEWAFTGNTIPAKAGVVPELATGNVYDSNGREYVYSKTVLFDRAFGIKSSDQSEGVHIDVTQQLNDMIAFGRLRAAQDNAGGLLKAGSNLFFTPRQELEKTGTLDLIDYVLPIDFNNTVFYQQDSTNDVVNWEANQAGVKNLWIRWAATITAEDFYNGKPAGFRISGGQDIAIINESVFSLLDRIWIWGGWDGFKLDSRTPFGGLFWQFVMSQCYVTQQLNQAYNFISIAQVSTTSSFRNCHAGCKVRDGVTNGGQSYLALQHMEASSPIEPGVTAGWEDYWEQESTPILTRPAWQSGVFYRTMGKGWNINNIQTTEMAMCSLDGAHNEQDGNVINCLNSVLSVGDFHLEGHNLSKADGISMLIGSDCNFGFLYMFDLRLRPGAGNTAYLFGGVSGRNRNFTLEGVRNQNQAASPDGVLSYINGGNDVTAFNAVSCGSGVPPHLTFNMPPETHYDRPIKLVILTGTGTPGTATYADGVKTYVITSGTASNPEYTVQREDSGATIQSDATGTMTVTFDGNVTPIGDNVRVVNTGSGGSEILGVNGTVEGSTTGASDKIIFVEKMTATRFLGAVSA